ncbi:inorganic triphosphatase [Xenorhabdus budapestensis]|uniref:CYTH domain-containing protein n=1 Tax=Xenorhabdus budapestensis TaxID=290110 RepID=UPI003A8B3896
MRSVEIELKLSVKPETISAIRNQLFQLPNHYTSPQHLTNIYFETPNSQLRRWDMGLRIRSFDEQYEMTIKTAGRVIGGLHQRPEFNVPLQQPELDLARFPAEIWPENTDLTRLQAQLTELFSTDFCREKWVVNYGQSEIEVVLDQGEIRAGERTSPICEFELELKTGDVSDVLLLADELAIQGGLRLANKSKAARGYALASNRSPAKLVEGKALEALEWQQPLSVLLAGILDQWQAQEEEWLAGIATGKTGLEQTLEWVKLLTEKQGETAPALGLLPELKEALSTGDAEVLCYSAKWLQCKLALIQWLMAQ